MNLWIIVISLLVIAIILLLASLFTNDDAYTNELEEKLDAYISNQSQELFAIKSRLNELEGEPIFGQKTTIITNDATVNDLDNPSVDTQIDLVYYDSIDDIDPEIRDEIIRYYAQGYTMHEISNYVGISSETIQAVIDDYIENR